MYTCFLYFNTPGLIIQFNSLYFVWPQITNFPLYSLHTSSVFSLHVIFHLGIQRQRNHTVYFWSDSVENIWPDVTTIASLSEDRMSGLLPPFSPRLSYLYVPSLPSQPQEGPGSPKRWYYLCAPHLRPPLCWNLAHPTKGNRWCTTVHGTTSVSVGRPMVTNVAGARLMRHQSPRRVKSHRFLCYLKQWTVITAFERAV